MFKDKYSDFVDNRQSAIMRRNSRNVGNDKTFTPKTLEVNTYRLQQNYKKNAHNIATEDWTTTTLQASCCSLHFVLKCTL